MKISEVRVIVCSPGRNYVTVKVITDDGSYGIGDATLNGREKAVVAYLEEHVAPCLIGRDPMRIEDIWQYLYRGAYWKRGPVTMCAISGIDVALWDLKAKIARMPLYQLLGGASRDVIPCYGHASGADVSAVIAAVEKRIDQGFRAVRAQVGLPEAPDIYGVGKFNRLRDGDNSLPREERGWSAASYMRTAPRLFEALRVRFGVELSLLHDVHHRLTPIEAAALGRNLEPFDLFWLEDPLVTETQESYRLLRQHTVVPIAVGEVFNTIVDAYRLIQENLIDFIRVTAVHAGGVTGLRRIIEIAGLHGVRTGFHGAVDMSPVTLAANAHLDLWAPNFGIQEVPDYDAAALDVFPVAWKLEQGALHPGEAPGHGADIDEAAAGRFPYVRSFLPVNRLADGTLWNW
jgi:mannonate dehydratase